ncbi:nuclear transport factor 2 family protein [Tsuneonella sp. HG222]
MAYRVMALALLALVPAEAQAQAARESLAQRVERLEDESTIRTRLIEYGKFLDAKDYHAYAALFAEDGVWHGGFGSFTGPAAIEAMLTANLGAPEPGFVNTSNFHMLTNPLIRIQGDRAQVESKYLFWNATAENRPNPLLAGRYVDEFVKRGGEWKIARRTTWGQIPFRDPNAPAAPGGGPAAAAPALSLEQRLHRAESVLAIQRIIVDYSDRIDRQDFDAYADLFTPDGVWQNGPTVRRGRAEIKAMLTGLFGTPPAGFVNRDSYHLVSNPQVDIAPDGNHATARSRHLLVMRGEGGAPTPMLAGFYEDELVRLDGAWKIAKRVDNPVMPTAEEWMKVIRARNAAR